MASVILFWISDGLDVSATDFGIRGKSEPLSFGHANLSPADFPPFGKQSEQIVPIVAFREGLREKEQLFVTNVSQLPDDLLWDADLQALPAFDRFDKARSLQQGTGSARVQPGEAAAHE